LPIKQKLKASYLLLPNPDIRLTDVANTREDHSTRRKHYQEVTQTQVYRPEAFTEGEEPQLRDRQSRRLGSHPDIQLRGIGNKKDRQLTRAPRTCTTTQGFHRASQFGRRKHTTLYSDTHHFHYYESPFPTCVTIYVKRTHRHLGSSAFTPGNSRHWTPKVSLSPYLGTRRGFRLDHQTEANKGFKR